MVQLFCFLGIFIDESGNFKERKTDEVIVHSILCMDYETYVDVSEQALRILDTLKLRFGIQKQLELHAKEIVNEESAWPIIPLPERIALLDRIVELIANNSVCMVCMTTYKRSHEKPSKAVNRAVSKLISCITQMFSIIAQICGVPIKYHTYTIIFDNAPYLTFRPNPRIETIRTSIIQSFSRIGVNKAGISVRAEASADHIGLQLSDVLDIRCAKCLLVGTKCVVSSSYSILGVLYRLGGFGYSREKTLLAWEGNFL